MSANQESAANPQPDKIDDLRREEFYVHVCEVAGNDPSQLQDALRLALRYVPGDALPAALQAVQMRLTAP